jgi:hypothetical protein
MSSSDFCFSDSSGTLMCLYSESDEDDDDDDDVDVIPAERGDDDTSVDSNHNNSESETKMPTAKELAKIERRKARKLAFRDIKRQRQIQFRTEIEAAILQDERMKDLSETMLGTVFQAKKAHRRSQMSLFRVVFREELCSFQEFDKDESPQQINDPSHIAEEHNDIPWDEWEEEVLLNWWDQPDLDEVCRVSEMK